VDTYNLSNPVTDILTFPITDLVPEDVVGFVIPKCHTLTLIADRCGMLFMI
jgi:hypothetical protein